MANEMFIETLYNITRVLSSEIEVTQLQATLTCLYHCKNKKELTVWNTKFS
jgi:hypothetical protein